MWALPVNVRRAGSARGSEPGAPGPRYKWVPCPRRDSQESCLEREGIMIMLVVRGTSTWFADAR